MSTATLHSEKNRTLVPQLRFQEFEGEWKNIKLGNYIIIKSGYSPSSYNFIDDGIYPFIKVEELNNCNKYQNASRFYSNENKNLVETFSVIFPKRGAAILNNKVRINDCPILMDSNMMAITPLRDKLHYEFLYYKIVKEELYKIADTSTIPQINNKHIEPYKLSIPLLSEQQKIASFLSAVDEKTQQLSRKKELLEQYKKGVMQQLFSGKLRFKDEDGKDYADWEEKKLGDVCTNISYGMNAAATTYDGQNKYLRITDIDESSDGLNLDKLTSPNGILEDKFRVKAGDLLFARTGASVGKTYLYRNSDGILYFAGFLIRFRVEGAIPAFVYLQTQTSKYKKWVKVMSMRSGQPGINAEEYKIFEISFPCLEEQQKIANFLSGIDVKIENTGQEINQMQNFKKGLLQQLFV